MALAAALLTLSGCTAAASVGVMATPDAPVVVLGKECGPTSKISELTVGLTETQPVWTIQAQPGTRPATVRDVTVGTVPAGFRATLDKLAGADLHGTLWVTVKTVDYTYEPVEFDMHHAKDGKVLTNGGDTVTPAAFKKSNGCT
jgi:hypothetical protein